MTGREAYRRFLKSRFWLELSSKKKEMVGECERCGSVEKLQCHHRIYRSDWYDTRLEDLEVLCREHHCEEHKIGNYDTYSPRGAHAFILYRDDWVFSLFLHRCHCLIQKMLRGRGLRDRDIRFLEKAVKRYPATAKDCCMEFHVGQVRQWWSDFKEGRYA